VLEAVVNVAEGRRALVLDRLRDACGPPLLDVHSDVDHERSVFTIAGPTTTETEDAVRRLADAVTEGPFDLGESNGVHPRLGILDVVPFVALGDTDDEVAVDAARRFARWLAATHGVPVFLYADADPGRRSLPAARSDAFTARAADAGPASPHPRLGATAVGARPPMIAVNCDLDTDDVGIARRIARAVRERDGGLAGVRALGFALSTRRCSQVSMNLVDLGATGLEAACTCVRALANADGHDVERVEIVGLVPAAEVAGVSDDFRAWSGVTDAHTIEAALARVATGDDARRSGAGGSSGPPVS
jgi:glutamate formiminotransferase / 5-formyltetrahydrofolate cyclo-ligase